MSVLKQTGDFCVTERHLSAHALIWGLPGQQTHGPAAFVYLCSTFKNWFLATGLIKTRDILVVLSRHCKVKMKIVSPPYSVKSLYEHFNKTIYSSHLVAIWRSSQKLRKKKNPTDFSQQSSKCSSYPHPRTEESKENEKVNLKHNYEIRSSLAKLGWGGVEKWELPCCKRHLVAATGPRHREIHSFTAKRKSNRHPG